MTSVSDLKATADTTAAEEYEDDFFWIESLTFVNHDWKKLAMIFNLSSSMLTE
jgi:hypothetical protein